MTFVIFLIEIIFSLSASLFLIYYFGNILKQNLFVTLSTSIVWFFSFIVIFLLPLDISSSFYEGCLLFNLTNHSCKMPYSYISRDPLRIIWYILYWILQLLSWVILPLFQSYVSVHYFSVWKKVLWAFIQNCFVYISLIFICVVIMVFLVVKEGWSFRNILSMAVTASNVWVLFFLIILVGYGLVELPRFLLQRFRYNSYLQFLYFQASKVYIELLEAEIQMKETEEEIRYFQNLIKYNDPFYKYVKKIVNNLPLHTSCNFEDIDDFQDYTSRKSISINKLEKLNEKAINSSWNLFLSSTQWKQLTSQILEMELIIDSTSNFSCMIPASLTFSKVGWGHSIFARCKWFWKVYLMRLVFIALFFSSLFFSMIILISEISIFLNQFARVTILAYIIRVGSYFSDYISSEFVSIMLLAYMSICAYYSVFRFRIFKKYRLCPNHQTNEFSLLFSAILLSRLITSMCLNYLYLVDLARLPSSSGRLSSEIKPAFFDIWGTNVPEIAVMFFIYFPLVIIIVVTFAIFQLDRRILSFFGFQQFFGDDEFTLELVAEGKQYIQIQKKRKSNISAKDSHTFENPNSCSISFNNSLHHNMPSLQQESNMTRDLVSNFIRYFPRKRVKTLPLIRSQLNLTPAEEPCTSFLNQNCKSLVSEESLTLSRNDSVSQLVQSTDEFGTDIRVKYHKGIFNDI